MWESIWETITQYAMPIGVGVLFVASTSFLTFYAQKGFEIPNKQVDEMNDKLDQLIVTCKKISDRLDDIPTKSPVKEQGLQSGYEEILYNIDLSIYITIFSVIIAFIIILYLVKINQHYTSSKY